MVSIVSMVAMLSIVTMVAIASIATYGWPQKKRLPPLAGRKTLYRMLAIYTLF